jgi:hypothetical protein
VGFRTGCQRVRPALVVSLPTRRTGESDFDTPHRPIITDVAHPSKTRVETKKIGREQRLAALFFFVV